MDNLKILDELLLLLSKTNESEFAYIINDINNNSEYLKEIDSYILHSAILKLVKDGYVNKKTKNSTDKIFKTPRDYDYYTISFEGIIFLQNGGYQNEYQKNQKEQIEYSELKKKQSLLEEKQVSNQFQIVVLTWIIALGTLIAGLYYIHEILAFFGVLTSRKI